MDFAPFKKPSRLAGLFSYRSVIPPSPHEILLAQIFMGAPAAHSGGHTQASYRLRRLFCKKPPARSLRCGSFSPQNFADANFRGSPGRPGGGCLDSAPFRTPGQKAGPFSYRSVIPPSPRETLLTQIFAGAPAARRAASRLRRRRAAAQGFGRAKPCGAKSFLRRLKSAHRAEDVVPFWPVLLYDRISSCERTIIKGEIHHEHG